MRQHILMPPSKPPLARKVAHQFTRHGVTITDDYAWLRDAGYPEVSDQEVLAYLNAENAWFESVMAPYTSQIDAISAELKARMKDEDASVPQKDGAFVYWSAFAPGAQYRTWYRCPVGGGETSVLLDEPTLAAGHDYFQLGGLFVSPDDRLLAYAVDDDGSERFTLRIRNLNTGELLPDSIENWRYGFAWAADSGSFLYTDADEHWRSKRVLRHILGTDPTKDRTLYSEAAEEFGVSVGLTQSRRYACITTSDHTTSEVYLLPADNFDTAPLLVARRREGIEYDVEEHADTLFIRVNDTHVNFRIVTAAIAEPGSWREFVSGSDRRYLREITCFEDFLVIEERLDGLDQIAIQRYEDGAHTYIPFPESSYTAELGNNPEYAIDRLRIGFESMVTPLTVFDWHVAQGRMETLKVQEIPSGYDASQYETHRLHAVARDGTRIPISIVHRRDWQRDGSGPVHLYGYGAYGYAVPPAFSTHRLSLLDRGFAFAIAHIRGGDDLGYRWYLDGRLDKRTNTFNDFVDVARFLIDSNYAQPGRITASGGSAGGELMGAIINQAPELFGAIVAHVPFVDVLNTMLDATLPLTPGEWPEWGNPIEDARAFATIRDYSPYDNVGAHDYPPMLVTAGLNDPRVTYWEPAKWVAKLRAMRTDDHVILLKTNMGAGHGGLSGRYTALREIAEEYAFLLAAMAGEMDSESTLATDRA
ncbi:MAG: S9 family peptidase [Pseudomonadales bacterium]